MPLLGELVFIGLSDDRHLTGLLVSRGFKKEVWGVCSELSA